MPLSEYKRDEEFPLEKTPAPLTDYNRRLKPLSHRRGPNSPSLAFGSRELVRGLNPRVTIIFAFSLYSCQFHDFPFVDEILSSRSNTCLFWGRRAGSQLVVLRGLCACCSRLACPSLRFVSREQKSRTSQLIQSFGKQQNHGAKIVAFFFLFFFVQKWSYFSLNGIPSCHRISQTLNRPKTFVSICEINWQRSSFAAFFFFFFVDQKRSYFRSYFSLLTGIPIFSTNLESRKQT